MSIRWRLTITYTSIVVGILILFGLAVYYISAQTLLDDIDNNLQKVAAQISTQTEAVFLQNIPIPVVSQDLNLFDVATVFIMVSDTDGNVLNASENLSKFQQLLDPSGVNTDRHFVTVFQQDRRLRVLSLPLTVIGDEGQQTIGYLQIGTLLDSYFSSLNRLRGTLFLAGLAALTLSLLIGAMFTPSSLKSLNQISATALQITKADDLGKRLPDNGKNDEISHLTRALNVTLERLEKLFRTQQRFLADISHELRTPLTAVRGNLDLMRRMGKPDEESLDVMQEELERMSRLVKDLLFLARADSGGLPIDQQRVELDTLFLDVYRQAQGLAKKVSLKLDSVDQVMIWGDKDRLKQVIFILVDNAIKYTPDGGQVTIALSKDETFAYIHVSDTGVGISSKDITFIFDRFYRVDKSRTRSLGGSGLGLSIAKWVVDAHNGTIKVASELNKGTTFEVRLPLLPEAIAFDPLSDNDLHYESITKELTFRSM